MQPLSRFRSHDSSVLVRGDHRPARIRGDFRSLVIAAASVAAGRAVEPLVVRVEAHSCILLTHVYGHLHTGPQGSRCCRHVWRLL